MKVATTCFDSLISISITEPIQHNTRVVFLESPNFIKMELQDISAIVQAICAVAPKVVIMIKNPWVARVLLKGLDFNIDISIYFSAKYIIGYV